MVDLGYYDPWYHDSLSIHKAVGILAAILLVIRYLWVRLQPRPMHLNPNNSVNTLMAKGAHALLYLSMFVLMISGYLISTAKGQGIDVFGAFEFPALLADSAERGELAGDIHELVATGFIILVGLHTAASLLHHFVFKDNTLLRMLRVLKS
ncbi:MAG: Cytochrome B561 [uncultured Thiotrichaceae bacterium]|uniref:Cytochrome B561 n=1 Tax=uncultured Thiotrichaceae bacterium TaxID=298394 RepID=A0A6S6TMV4_9GAMM|nr:MAG: Cytochrome B561 [uncultured Thiotrichaceae bacterium]